MSPLSHPFNPSPHYLFFVLLPFLPILFLHLDRAFHGGCLV